MPENDIGIGVGLQATLPEARDFFMANQQQQLRLQNEQLRLNQEKRAKQQDALEKAQKDFKLTGNYKWHKLLTKEAIAASNQAIDDLMTIKAEGGDNWENKIPDIQKAFNERMIPLVSLNENYQDFDSQNKMFDTGTSYSTTNMQKAREAFSGASDVNDFKARLKQLGVQSDRFLAVDPEEGYVVATPPRRLNLDAELKAAATALPTVPIVKITYQGDKVLKEKVEERPLTKQDALDAYNNATDRATRFPNGVPPSIEDAVEKMMSHPEFVYQYADSHGFNPEDTERVGNRLFEDMKLYTGHKESSTMYMPRTTNVNVSTGDRIIENITKRKPQPNTFATRVGEDPNPLYAFNTFTPGVEYTVESVTGSMSSDSDDGKISPTSLGGKKSRVDTYYVAPYVMINGKKVPATDERIKDKSIAGVDVFFRFTDGSRWYSELAEKYSPSSQISGNQPEKVGVSAQIKILEQQADLMETYLKKWSADPSNKGKGNKAFIEAGNEYIQTLN